jgi:hypothetical protein
MTEHCPTLYFSGYEIKNNERAGYVAHMEEKRNVHRVFVGKPEGKRLLETLDVDGKIILKSLLKKKAGRA